VGVAMEDTFVMRALARLRNPRRHIRQRYRHLLQRIRQRRHIRQSHPRTVWPVNRGVKETAELGPRSAGSMRASPATTVLILLVS